MKKIFSKFIFLFNGKNSLIKKKFISVLKKDGDKRQWIIELIFNELEKKDIITRIFFDKDSKIFQKKFTCYLDYLRKYFNILFNFTFEILIFEFAKSHALIPYFFSSLNKVKNVINDYAKKINYKNSRCKHTIDGNKLEIILNKIPFSIMYLKDILRYVDTIKEDLLYKEQLIRLGISDSNEKESEKIYDAIKMSLKLYMKEKHLKKF